MGDTVSQVPVAAPLPRRGDRALSIDRQRLWRGFQQGLWCVAAALVVTKAVATIGHHWSLFGLDFRGTNWHFGRDALRGENPYPAADPAALLAQGNPAVYPAAILALAVPFSLLPVGVAIVVWDLLSIGCIVAALRLVGVRDWRVYAVVLVSAPVASTLLLGQLDGILALLCALIWRYRDRAVVAGAGLGAVVAAKLFLWPLALWLMFTRRAKAAVLGVVVAVLATLVAWACIGFAGLRQYGALLAANATAFEGRGVSVVASGMRAGLGGAAARPLAVVAALVLLVIAYRLVRRGAPDRAFAAAVAAATLSSPILWIHSTLALVVAFAVVRPRYTSAWLVPLALWAVLTENPTLPTFVAAQTAIVATIVVALRSPETVRP